MTKSGSSVRLLGTFMLSMVSISAIISLRNFQFMAAQGYAIIFYCFLAALFFFIPTALIAAELVSGWPGKGGIYHWVTQAFGKSTGGFAVWLEWAEGVVWMPTALSFIAVTFAYFIQPFFQHLDIPLAKSPTYLFATMLIILWIMTLINCFGIKISSRFSAFGVLLGSIIPSIIIIGLGLYWLQSGRPLEIAFSLDALIPEFSFNTMILSTGILLSFSGIEVAAYHIQDTKNPKTTFPRATFISAGLILTLYALGALAIAYVIPQKNITLTGGVMQAFEHFLKAFHLEAWLPVMAGMILLGAMALLNTWILGPSKGLLVSAESGNLPGLFSYVNRFGAPTPILIAQAMIASLLCSVFLFMPSVNSSYWILIVLTSQLVLLMYFLMFMSAIHLRIKEPNTPRVYKVPGGLPGMICVAGIGAFASLGTFLVGFIPPSELALADKQFYITFLATSVIVFCLPPFLWYGWKKIRS
jgi:glutamate:GABA antiporter